MKISIVIVSWNTKDLLKKCLDSLVKYGKEFDLEIFVIDNASTDGTTWMMKNDFPEINFIPNKENAGFAKANNQGIKRSTGDYILLLNPDTEIFADTLANSVKFMEENKDCGVMGCRMVYKNGKPQSSVRRFPRLWPIIMLLLKLPKIFPHLRSIERYLAIDFDYEKTQPVDQVMGAYMFVRPEVFDKIGTLDEDFFIWFEEVDFCRRAWKAGYKVMYYSGTKIIHHGGQSFAQQKMVKNQMNFFKSAWKYFRKNGI